MKLFFICLIVLFFVSSCTTIKCSIRNDLATVDQNRISIKPGSDPIKIAAVVSNEAKKIGFNSDNLSDSLNAYLTYDYVYYFDVFHYTLNIFSLMVVKNDTKEVLASAFCTGDSPSGAAGIVKATFGEFGSKIQSLKHK